MVGENLHLNIEVSFWDKHVRDNMPNSNFVLQDNLDNLHIIIDNSNFSGFTSNITINKRIFPNRVIVKIIYKIASVDFYLIYNKFIDKNLVRMFSV